MTALSTSLLKYTNAELREKFQDFNIENEEFVPLFFRGYETDYKISKYGNVLGKRGQKLKWTNKDTKVRACARVSIYPSNKGTFEDDGYTYTASNRCTSVYLHRMVALHFLPFPEHLPEELKNDWSKVSETTQNIIKDSLQVDHLDGNPYNPRWDNLEWVTAKENTRRYILSKNNS